MTKEERFPLYAVYGSLRKDEYNYKYHLKNRKDVEYVGNFITEPIYKMLDLGQYPGLLENGDTSINLEVYKIKSKEIEDSLDLLEGYNSEHEYNYYEKDIINTPFGPAYIYIYSHAEIDDVHNKFVESGDWIDHLNSNHV